MKPKQFSCLKNTAYVTCTVYLQVLCIISFVLENLAFFGFCFRFVGPYLKICPEHVFVVEDGDGLCGFAVATSDSKHFYEQFKKHWLPEVCTCLKKTTSILM